MRSRTIREGSVGLLILVGLGLFGLLIFWLRGLSVGTRSYRAIIEFADVGGMQSGAPLRYRGVNVGQVTAIRPGANAIEVEVEISPATLSIPKNVIIQANQSGLVGETSIDITPQEDLPPTAVASSPLAPDCNSSLIICDGDRIPGEVGVNFTELLTSTIRFTELFANEEFFSEIRTLTRNTSTAAENVTDLTREVTTLARSLQQQVGSLSASARTSTNAVTIAANQIGLTAAQARSLLDENRSTLVTTLGNLNRSSTQLQVVLDRVSPTVENGQLIQNLETLSANAAQASANLRDLSQVVGSSENILLLQETLDSARATFQNAQKITADLDELTGDPDFRRNLRDLVNGLNSLVSSTQQLQQQTAIAQVLTPTAIALTQQEQTRRNVQLSPSSENLSIMDSQNSPRLHPIEGIGGQGSGIGEGTLDSRP